MKPGLRFTSPLKAFSLLALGWILPYLLISQNHPNGLEFIGPDGLVYPDVSNAGVQGGIPTNLPVVATVSSTTSNDRQAILNGIAAAHAAGGGIVLLQNGEYDLFDHIRIPHSNIVIKGQSRKGVVIRLRNATANAGIIWFAGRGRLGPRNLITQYAPRGSKRLFLNPTELAQLASFYQVGKWVWVNVIREPIQYQNKFHLSPTRGYYRESRKIVAVGPNYIDLDHHVRAEIDPDLNSYVEPIDICSYVGVENLTIVGDSTRNWAHGVSFDWVVNGWIKDVTIIRPPSYPFNCDWARHIEIQGCYFEFPWYRGGGGVGYGGFWACADCLWENSNTDRMRHAPNMQALAIGCVIKNSTFDNSDAHWHLGWVRESLFDNIVVNKGSNGMPYLFDVPVPDNSMHDPIGPLNGIYNSDFHGGIWGAGFKLGAFAEKWVFSHNRIHSPLFKAPPTRSLIEIYDWGSDTYFYNNVFWTTNRDAKNNSVFAMFIPGFQPGFGQTGNNVHEALNPSYSKATPQSSQPIPNTSEIHFINNKVYGINPARGFVGEGMPMTNVNTEYFPQTSTAPPRPQPPVASIHSWQVTHKQTHGPGSGLAGLGFFRGAPIPTGFQLMFEAESGAAKYFEIERSTDNERFESIGRVNAMPAEKGVSFYLFNDQQVEEGQKYYYRLRMVRPNDVPDRTPSIELEKKSKADAVVRMGPNPVYDQLNVLVTYPLAEQLTVAIYDTNGRLMAEQKLSEPRYIEHELVFNLKSLPASLYFLVVSSPRKVLHQGKLLKVD